MSSPRVTYLTFDSLSEGIGFSQVFHYVTRLAQSGVEIELHTFEKAAPSESIRDELERAGVAWRPHPFGRPGPLGGLLRVIRGAWATRRAVLLHARSDVAAASALLARPRAWVWDVRSFWREQRISLGMLQPDSAEARVLEWVEGAAARRSSAIVVLAEAALPVLAQRFGADIAAKSHVISTCVDLTRFTPTALPPSPPLRLLLAGTLNAFYDIPATLRFVERLRRDIEVELTIAAPAVTRWDDVFARAGAVRISVAPEEMPPLIERHHAGLSICRFEAGVSLRAAMPTKIAEFLACGRPVVVNRGLGDADAIVRAERCGVVMASASERDIDTAAAELLRLLQTESVLQRCRGAAERYFSLDAAVQRLIEVYRLSSPS